MTPGVTYSVALKDTATIAQIMDVLHLYPDVFIQGIFEEMVMVDLHDSDLIVAREGDRIVGCVLFDPVARECNWLAVAKDAVHPKRDIARGLFQAVEQHVPPGTELHLFVNTEDASYPGHPEFSGAHSEPARNFYRSMGWTFGPKIVDKFGPGAHGYEVRWITS